MTTYPNLQAVVESPYYEGTPLYPWQIADYQPFSLIQLSGKMTDLEVGLIFAQLVQYNHLESEGDANKVLHGVIQAKTLILRGFLGLDSVN